MKIDNRGSFTVEAVFVMLIIIGVILSMLFVILYSFERVNVECEMRNDIHCGMHKREYEGQLGSGIMHSQKIINILICDYILEYKIPFAFPLTSQYVESHFFKLIIRARVCKNNATDVVRQYDALRDKR